MEAHLPGRRRFLGWVAMAVAGLGLDVQTRSGLGALAAGIASAAEPPAGTSYTATGIFENSGTGSEQLVALILVPLGAGASPRIRAETGLQTRDLGVGPLEAFSRIAKGMYRREVGERGSAPVVVYSVRTPEGDYVEVVPYLLTGTELEIENPRDRLARARRRTETRGVR